MKGALKQPFKKNYLFCFCLCWVSVAAVFLVAESGLLSVAVRRLLNVVVSLVEENRFQGARALSLWLLGSLEHRLSSCGAVAPRHVRSSQIRDRTRVSCTGRQFTTEPPGSPRSSHFYNKCFDHVWVLKQLESLELLHHSRIDLPSPATQFEGSSTK